MHREAGLRHLLEYTMTEADNVKAILEWLDGEDEYSVQLTRPADLPTMAGRTATLLRSLLSAPAPSAIAPQKPVAWMRKWAFDGETPKKEKNENGRWAWPAKFRMRELTRQQVFPDDVPLFSPVPEEGDTQPCCFQWHTCTKRCSPLAENWRMAAKRAEPDAERYRWMKREVKRIPPGWELVGWDAAIDAAMRTDMNGERNG